MKRMRIHYGLLLATAAGVCLLQAGSLEPPGPPAPTMKSLEQIPSSWHLQLGTIRFEVVMNGEGVLDHETGLVWQQHILRNGMQWAQAVGSCRLFLNGGRYGWRLPSVEELATLIDPNQSDPALPPLHPFTRIDGEAFDEFWTSSSFTLNPSIAWTVTFEGNGDTKFLNEKGINGYASVWCVRGSIGLDTGRP